MRQVEVHFDFVEIGEDVEVGAMIVEDGEVVKPKLESYKNKRRYGNHYHFSILAWVCAVKLLREYIEKEGEVIDRVVFKNQNELISQWVDRGKYPAAYESVIKRLYMELDKLAEMVYLQATFKKIDGKDNMVKKMLKKRKQKKEKEVEREMTFGGRLKSKNEEAKVVNLWEKRKLHEN